MRDLDHSEPPLKLFYWAAPNFGDALSKRVVEFMSGREVVHVRPKKADLFAVGSLMHMVSKHFSEYRRPHNPPILWGTGVLNPFFKKDFVPHIDVRILRGPISAVFLKKKMKEFGDPGLFAPEAIGQPDERRDQIAIIPHHSQMENPVFQEVAASDTRFKLVDVRKSPEEVCLEIAASAHVFSASLHGLIVADAYGVPNTWIDPGKQVWMKYHDYAASVGRFLLHPIEIDEVPEHARRAADGPLPYADGIAQSRASLFAHFPAELRSAHAPTAVA